MRVTLKLITLLPTNVFKVKRRQFLNFTRALSQQQVTISNQETLTGRLFDYLNVDKEQTLRLPKSVSELFRDVRQNPNAICKLSTQELLAFSNTLIDGGFAEADLRLTLHDLDKEFCLRLSELSTYDILRLLSIYMNIIPNQISSFNLYKQSVNVLYNSLSTLSFKDLLQLIFYIGLKKKSLESQTMLRQCLKHINNNVIANLTSEELCIICNATFKTSTKIINKKLLDRVRSYINNNLSIFTDPPVFVTFIKTIRHNRYQNDDLLNTLLCTICFNQTFKLYSFPVNNHILALFADHFFYDESFFKIMTLNCLEQLKESSFLSKQLHPAKQLRGKDIKRFLWVMSMFSEMKLLSHDDIKNVIIQKLLERIKFGEFEGDVESLIDIILYLWMLRYQAHELVPYIFKKKNWHLLDIHPKSKERLNLLLQAISIENHDLSNTISTKPIGGNKISTYQLQKRPLIQRLLTNLQQIRGKIGIAKFELSQEIPHLNILGITGYKTGMKKAVHIEVLDDYTKIRNIREDIPVGLMALKLRLLNQLEEGVLLVSQREAEELSEAELNDYLLDELKLICYFH